MRSRLVLVTLVQALTLPSEKCGAHSTVTSVLSYAKVESRPLADPLCRGRPPYGCRHLCCLRGGIPSTCYRGVEQSRLALWGVMQRARCPLALCAVPCGLFGPRIVGRWGGSVSRTIESMLDTPPSDSAGSTPQMVFSAVTSVSSLVSVWRYLLQDKLGMLQAKYALETKVLLAALADLHGNARTAQGERGTPARPRQGRMHVRRTVHAPEHACIGRVQRHGDMCEGRPQERLHRRAPCMLHWPCIIAAAARYGSVVRCARRARHDIADDLHVLLLVFLSHSAALPMGADKSSTVQCARVGRRNARRSVASN